MLLLKFKKQRIPLKNLETNNAFKFKKQIIPLKFLETNNII